MAIFNSYVYHNFPQVSKNPFPKTRFTHSCFLLRRGVFSYATVDNTWCLGSAGEGGIILMEVLDVQSQWIPRNNGFIMVKVMFLMVSHGLI